tara:strand:+ start:13559 stop:13768 length:210 start_codon:yes stop_codon:yes gene_type:complete
MEYEVTVYRTMVQKVTLVKESSIPLSNEVVKILKEEAEDEAAEMYDYEWTDVSSDIEYTWTGIERKKQL